MLPPGGDVGEGGVEFPQPAVLGGVQGWRRADHKHFDPVLRRCVQDVGQVQPAAGGGNAELNVAAGESDEQAVFVEVAEPPAGLLQPASGQAFCSFLRAGEGVTFQGHAVLRSAGQDAAQPAKGPGIAKSGQQFISNSCEPQLPVFHKSLFTSVPTDTSRRGYGSSH